MNKRVLITVYRYVRKNDDSQLTKLQ